jgi:hypothetical protein
LTNRGRQVGHFETAIGFIQIEFSDITPAAFEPYPTGEAHATPSGPRFTDAPRVRGGSLNQADAADATVGVRDDRRAAGDQTLRTPAGT